jgi:hypothetical protein
VIFISIYRKHIFRFGKAAPLKCDVCFEDVYDEELVHYIDGSIICPECFDDFVFDYFKPQMILVSELKEELYSDHEYDNA